MSHLNQAITRIEENIRTHKSLLESDTLVQKSYAADFSKLRSQKAVEEQEQLLSWLVELKSCRDMLAQLPDRSDYTYQHAFEDGYNKCLKDTESSLKSEICSKDAAYITPTSIDNMISNIMNKLREGRKDGQNIPEHDR